LPVVHHEPIKYANRLKYINFLSRLKEIIGSYLKKLLFQAVYLLDKYANNDLVHQKDYKKCTLSVMTAAQYLKAYHS